MTDNLPIPARASTLHRQDREPAAGQYWEWEPEEMREGDRRVTGRAYLVSHVHVIDGAIHSVNLAAHPEGGEGGVRVSLDAFLKDYQYQPDGDAIRAGEIGVVADDIARLQRLLADQTQEAAAPPESVRPGQLAGPSSTEAEDTVQAIVASGRSVADMAQVFEARRDRMLALSESISATTKDIGERTQVLARFYQEKAGAAIAAVNDVIAEADRLKKGVVTLGLFAGDGVKVNLIRDGEPLGPGHRRLAIRQLRLFLDEELVCHIDDEGGADHSNISDLGGLLESDPELLDRILPEKLGVVLMRYRRRPKEYNFQWARGINADIANMLVSIQEAEANQEQFLLVRNGDKVWQVRAIDALQDIPRLFPRERDLDDVYRRSHSRFLGIESSTITPRDLEYVEARGRFEQMALEYRRVLVLLWGLDQRLKLFGDFHDRRRHPGFLTAEFQEECLEFIADEENVIGSGLPNVRSYIAEQNERLEAGSRILVRWYDVLSEETCPAVVTYDKDYRPQFKYNPTRNFEVVTVERRGGDLVAPIEVRHPYRETERRFYVKLEPARGHGYLVLDRVRTSDIGKYLASRIERVDYLDYVPTFLRAHSVLKPIEASEAGALADMIERAGGPASRDHVMEALTHWRVSHGWILPADEPSVEKAKQLILEQTRRLAGDVDVDAVEAIRGAIAARGDAAFRIGFLVTGEAIALAAVGERPDKLPFPWVREYILSTKGKIMRSRFVMPDEWRSDAAVAFQRDPARQDEATASLHPRPSSFYRSSSPEAVLSLARHLAHQEELKAWKMIMDPDQIVERAGEFFRLARSGKHRIEAVSLDMPLGAWNEKGTVKTLIMTLRPISALLHLGEHASAKVEAHCRAWYRHPEKGLENLRSDRPVGFVLEHHAGSYDVGVHVGRGAYVIKPENLTKDSVEVLRGNRTDEILTRLGELGWLGVTGEKA